MNNTDIQRTVRAERGQRAEKTFFMFKFFLSCSTIWILIHSHIKMLQGVAESSLNSMDYPVHHFTSSWVPRDSYNCHNLAHKLKPTPSSGAQPLKFGFNAGENSDCDGQWGQSVRFCNSNLLTDFQIFLFSLNILLKTSSNTQRNWKNYTKSTDIPTSYVLSLLFSLTAFSHLFIHPSLSPSILFISPSYIFGILKKIFFLAVPHSMWDLSPPKRNQSHAPCIGGSESQPLDCQEGPHLIFVTFQRQLLRRHTSACESLTRIRCVCIISLRQNLDTAKCPNLKRIT